MSRISVVLLFALLFSVALAFPTLIRETDGKGPTPEPSETPEEVCVDVKYLESLGHTRDQLVHSSHILTNTLCPTGGLPCGTANHMVRFNGESMSYEELCQRMPCTNKVTSVNSVFSHIWEDKVHGEVALTMFDARHPEMIQRALHRLSHTVRKILG